MTTYPAAVADDELTRLDADVLAALVAYRDWHRAKGVLLKRKRLALRALEVAGLSRRAVAERVCALLLSGGWSPEDIDVVGVSVPQVRADLERARGYERAPV